MSVDIIDQNHIDYERSLIKAFIILHRDYVYRHSVMNENGQVGNGRFAKI